MMSVLLSRRSVLALMTLTALAGPAGAEPRVLIDSVGRQVVAPEKVTKVLAAGPPASILIYALAPDAMSGWVPVPSVGARPFLLQTVRDLPASPRLTIRGAEPDLDKITAAKPDLILDFGSIGGSYTALAEKVQTGTNIPYALIDGRLDKLPASLRLAGNFLSRLDRGEALATYAEQTLKQLDAVLAEVPADKRPKVYVARGPDGLQSVVKGSGYAEVVERAGAINVVDGKGGRGGAIDVTLAQLSAWKPDVILAFDDGAYDAMRKAGPAGARVLKAPSLPWNWLGEPPSLNRLMGLRWLTAVLYPAPKRGSTDLRAEAREFHRLFYGVTPSDADLAALLDGAQ
jgi:iron complex transport system substrate-binding protein